MRFLSSPAHRSRTRSVLPLFALLLFVSASLPALAAPKSRTTFTNSVGPLPPGALATVRPEKVENLAETQEIEVPLRMRDYPKLLERIGRHEVLAPAELTRDH